MQAGLIYGNLLYSQTVPDKAEVKTDTAVLTQEISVAEELERFKEGIWKEINAMSWGSDISIQITDEAFRKMMNDSEFKNKMMNLIREDSRGSHIMCGGTLIHIDENGYKGYSYMAGHEKEAGAAFAAHSKDKDAFYAKKVVKKQDYMKFLEEKLRKQELAEMDLRAELERKRLNRFRLNQAVRTYEKEQLKTADKPLAG